MTKEELEGNILISTLFGEPMPFHDSRKGKIMLYFKPGHTTAHCQDYELEYNSDWNWLMSAVEKIEEDTSYKFRIEGLDCEVYSIVSDGFIRHKNSVVEKTENLKTELVFKCVIEFINWYNLQKP